MDKNDFINLGPLDKLPLGQGACFVVNEERIVVFRTRAGELHAIQDRCPHRRGPLSEGIIDNCQVICPYHGHKFDLRSGDGTEEGESVTVYEVHEKNGELYLKV